MMIVNSTAPQSRPKTQFGALYKINEARKICGCLPRPAVEELAQLQLLLRTEIKFGFVQDGTTHFQVGEDMVMAETAQGIMPIPVDTIALTPTGIFRDTIVDDDLVQHLITDENSPNDLFAKLKEKL